jgi:hypothetical protein
LQLSSLTATAPARAARIKKAKMEGGTSSCSPVADFLTTSQILGKNNSAYDMMPKFKPVSGCLLLPAASDSRFIRCFFGRCRLPDLL